MSQSKVHLHLPVTGTPQCPCSVYTGHRKTDYFIIGGVRDDFALQCLCVAPPSGSSPPLHQAPHHNEHFAYQRYCCVYCERSLWPIYGNLSKRVSSEFLALQWRCSIFLPATLVANVLRLIYSLTDTLSMSFNTLRTGAFKLFKCTFPGSKQFKSI